MKKILIDLKEMIKYHFYKSFRKMQEPFYLQVYLKESKFGVNVYKDILDKYTLYTDKEFFDYEVLQVSNFYRKDDTIYA